MNSLGVGKLNCSVASVGKHIILFAINAEKSKTQDSSNTIENRKEVKEMKPIKTETCNAVYTLEGCNDLPVTKYTNANNGEEGVESVWELSPDEIKQIQETGKVFLYIQGATIPPVLLTTESQIYFKEEGETDAENA